MAVKLLGKQPPKGKFTKEATVSELIKDLEDPEEVKACYCRKCRRVKRANTFYVSVDRLIDTNGRMSICSECCNEMCATFIESGDSYDKAILKTCRAVNIRFDLEIAKNSYNSMKIAKSGIKVLFGTYKMNLTTVFSRDGATSKVVTEDMTFQEPRENIIDNPLTDEVSDADYLRMFWGTNIESEDYEWLENELSEWSKTHKSDTKAEKTLLKEICFKGLEIRRARKENRSTGNLLKEYQDLMKTANVDPAKTSIAGSGKSQDTFSSFIKTIEETEPAEYYQDPDLFKDFSNIEFYFKKYLTRPLKNFLKIGPPDFNVTESDDEEYSDIDVEEILANQ